jgi:hypothetical protein
MPTGSFTPTRSLPGSTTSAEAGSRDAGSAASNTSTRQCFVPVVAQLTYSRKVSSSVTTSAGFMADVGENGYLLIYLAVRRHVDLRRQASALCLLAP